MPLHYLTLIAAIICETIGTAALQASQQFTRPVPSVLVVLGYGAAFYLLSLTLKAMPVGVVYAIWSGLGVVLIALIGWAAFGQRIDMAGAIGIGLILAGVATIHLFSGSATH